MHPAHHWLNDCLRSVVTVHAPTLDRVGTGFVVSADGHLLTAAHCVVDDSAVPAGGTHKPEADITVAFRDGGTARAELVGFDMHADVAVLRLPPGMLLLTPISVRRHTYPPAGDTCVVVGNVFGQDPRSVAVGAVRNGRWKDPHGLSLLSTVLTDVATSAGTSGGPILDATGHVVALHTAAYGAPQPLCRTCGLIYRSVDDLVTHRGPGRTLENREDEYGGRTTQLGGGLASPLLWRVYRAILERHQHPSPGHVPAYKCTLPCITIPCATRNVARIRLAVKDPTWHPPPEADGACVVVRTTPTSKLRLGDMILAVDGVRVAGRDTPTPHDVTWFRPHGTPCLVQVLRAGLPMDISVEHKILDYTADVSVGTTHASKSVTSQQTNPAITQQNEVVVARERGIRLFIWAVRRIIANAKLERGLGRG
jgi:hypothetical protein